MNYDEHAREVGMFAEALAWQRQLADELHADRHEYARLTRSLERVQALTTDLHRLLVLTSVLIDDLQERNR